MRYIYIWSFLYHNSFEWTINRCAIMKLVDFVTTSRSLGDIYLAQFQRLPTVTHDDERHGVTLDVAAVACEDAFIRHLVAEGRVVVIREHGWPVTVRVHHHGRKIGAVSIGQHRGQLQMVMASRQLDFESERLLGLLGSYFLTTAAVAINDGRSVVVVMIAGHSE